MRRVLTFTFALSLTLLVGCDQPQQPAAGQSTNSPVAPIANQPVLATSHSAAVHEAAKAETKVVSASRVKTAPVAQAQAEPAAQVKTAPAFSPVGPVHTAAEPGAAVEEITCAIIPAPQCELPDSVVVGMLGVQLSDVPGLALVERTEVDKVLKEQALQRAFAPEGVKERRSLGTLLKARLLLLMRAGERKAGDRDGRWIDLSICDTDSGLRMAQETFLWDDRSTPELTARRIVEAVKKTRERLGDPVRTVVAVPPLVSDDLLHRYDAMQEAYARLMSANFMHLPGVQVAELAEARALLDEQRLTAGNAARRPVAAFFITGRYRNNGEGAARRVNLSFELKRGDKLLDRQEVSGVEPGKERGFLNTLGRKWLDLMQLQGFTPFNPSEEINALLPQSGVLSSIGDHEHALGLIEAALLLKPSDQYILAAAMRRCADIANASFYSPKLDPKGYAERARHGLELARRGCEHLEQFLALGEERKWNGGKPLSSLPDYDEMHPSSLNQKLDYFWRAGKEIIEARNADPEVRRLVSELGKTKRELMLALYERMAARGQTNMADYWHGHDVVYDEQTDALSYSRTTQYDMIDYVLFDCTPIEEPLAETFQARLRAINLCRKMLGGTGAIPYCETYATYHLPMADPAYMPFLGQLDTLASDADWKKLIKKLRLRADVEVRQARQKKNAYDNFNIKAGSGTADESATRPAAAAPQAASEPMPPQSPTDEFRLVPLRGIKVPRQAFSGWIPAGRTADLLWTRTDLYIMRTKGKLDPLYHSGEHELWTNTVADPIRRVIYDGRYAWAVQNDRLTVIDPENGAVARVDAASGLPPGDMLAAPLAPGRVCVVGATERTWCATVDFVPGGKSRVDIFHEARLQTGEWDDPRLAFKPAFAVTVRDAAQTSAPRVLVGRYCVGRASHLMLLLDPARRTAEVVPERVSNLLRPPMLTEMGGSVWWIEHNADRLAVDYITANKDKPAPPPIDEKKLEEISARNIAEAKAKGKQTKAVMVGQIGIEVGEVTPQPNKPFIRLLRFGPPAWRPEVVLNNAISSNWLDESGGHWDRVTHTAGFLDGRCYAFDAEKNCWWLDLERGRSVKLRGYLKGSISEVWKRVFQSNHYGLVLQEDLDGVPGVGCFQFVPLFDPDALRAELDHGNASRHEVLNQDPLELRNAVIRCYKDWRAKPDAFTTMTAPIDGGAVMVEHQVLPEHTVLTLVGAEQPDPEVRRLLRQTVLMFNYGLGGDEVIRYVKSHDAARFFRLDREELAKAPEAPQPATIQDALGRPLAGAEVRVTYARATSWSGIPFEKAHFSFPCGRTDARGGFSFPLQWQTTNTESGKRPGQIEIRHPACGTMRIENWLERNDEASPEQLTVRLPLAAREDVARTLRGQVVDAAGKPIAGAMIWCDQALEPNGHALAVKPFRVFCDREGRFCFYPVIGLAAQTPPFKLVPGMRFLIKIKDPARPHIPSRNLVLDNDREQLIHWDEDLRMVRFVVKDESGKTLDYHRESFSIAYRCSPEVKKLADELEIPNFSSYEPFSDSSNSDVMTSLTLKRIGWYDVRSFGSLKPVQVQITPDSLPEIVVVLPKKEAAPPPPITARRYDRMVPTITITTASLTLEPASKAPAHSPNKAQWFLAVYDAFGKSIPEVEVTVKLTFTEMGSGYGVFLGSRREPQPPRHVACGRFRADASGRFWVRGQGTAVGQLAEAELTVAHPDYGTAVCTVNGSLFSRVFNTYVSRESATTTGTAPNVLNIYAPLLRRDGTQREKALRGRLVDAAGQPVAGVRVYAWPYSNPSQVRSFHTRYASTETAAVSDAEGRFEFTPVFTAFRPGDVPMIPADFNFLLVLDDPARPEWDQVLVKVDKGTRGEEHMIQVPPAPRRIRIRIQDEKKQPLDPAKIRPKITRIDILRQRATGKPAPVIFDGETGTPWPGSFELKPGQYMITSKTVQINSSMMVTQDSSGELVFTGRPYSRPQPVDGNSAASAVRSPGTANPNLAVRSSQGR